MRIKIRKILIIKLRKNSSFKVQDSLAFLDVFSETGAPISKFQKPFKEIIILFLFEILSFIFCDLVSNKTFKCTKTFFFVVNF